MNRAGPRVALALLVALPLLLAPATAAEAPLSSHPLAVAGPSPRVGALSLGASYLDMGGAWNCGRGSETVNLFANATGGSPPYTYVWDFGDLTPASDAADPVHTYNGVGPYTATVTVVDHAGAYANASVTPTYVIPPTCDTSSPSPMGTVLYVGLLAAVGVGVYLLVRWHRGRIS